MVKPDHGPVRFLRNLKYAQNIKTMVVIHAVNNTKWFKFLAMLLLANVFLSAAKAQSTLSINEVYGLARKNYPLIKQRDLLTKAKEYSVSNAAKGYLPAFSVNGQATYQSAVTNFPFTIP